MVNKTKNRMSFAGMQRSALLSNKDLEVLENNFLDKDGIAQSKLIISDEMRPIANAHLLSIFPNFYKYFLQYIPFCKEKKHHHHHHHHENGEVHTDENCQENDHDEEHNAEHDEHCHHSDEKSSFKTDS